MGGGGERVYLLAYMVVTFLTCQAERLPLKVPAPANTAPQQQKEKSKDKYRLKKRIRAKTIKRKKRQTKKDPILWRGGGGRMYVLLAMFITSPTCQVERSPLKAPARANTAPHSNKEKSKDKNGFEKKKRREHFQK